MRAEGRGADGQGCPGSACGSLGGPGGYEGPRPGGTGEAWAVAQAVHAPGPCAGVVAGPSRPRPGGQQPHFSLTVPFPSFMEAEMAHQFLAPHAQPRGGAGVEELTVSGNLLMIRLTGEDPVEIRNSITSCLDQLSLLVFPPCFFIEFTMEKGG